MTNEERKAQIAALVEERRGYVNRGLDDRAALVDAELKRLGGEGKKPSKRAEKRPAGKASREER